MRVQIDIDDSDDGVSVTRGRTERTREPTEAEFDDLSGESLSAGRAEQAAEPGATGFNPAGLPPMTAAERTAQAAAATGVHAEQQGIPLDIAHSMDDPNAARVLPHGTQQYPRGPRRGQVLSQGDIVLGNEY